VSDSAMTILLYTGGGLVVVVLIFLGALWFANSAKKGNMRFKWAQRRAVAERSGAGRGPRRESNKRHNA
jgi:hypothetical protein